MQVITRDEMNVRKAKAAEAWASLNDPETFATLSVPEKAELLRVALVYLLKDRLGDELPG